MNRRESFDCFADGDRLEEFKWFLCGRGIDYHKLEDWEKEFLREQMEEEQKLSELSRRLPGPATVNPRDKIETWLIAEYGLDPRTLGGLSPKDIEKYINARLRNSADVPPPLTKTDTMILGALLEKFPNPMLLQEIDTRIRVTTKTIGVHLKKLRRRGYVIKPGPRQGVTLTIPGKNLAEKHSALASLPEKIPSPKVTS